MSPTDSDLAALSSRLNRGVITRVNARSGVPPIFLVHTTFFSSVPWRLPLSPGHLILNLDATYSSPRP